MREAVLVLIVVAVGALALWWLTGCGGSNSSSTSASASAPSTDSVRTAANRFLDRYVTRDGRVSRIDQGGDTVGEGQAYGMLIAAAIGDHKRFDLIWDWTQKNLQRPDGLISFLWKAGHVQDPQAASDADLDASRALLVASCRFHEPHYRHQALSLARSIMSVEVASVQGKPVLTAGPWAVTPPITIDPSYFSPATFTELHKASGDSRWAALATSARSITGELMPRPGRLPPDWARLEGGRPVAIGSPGNPQSPPTFGFDAVRTLIRMTEDPKPAGREIAARAWPVFENADPTKLPVEHNMAGHPTGHTLHPVVLVAAAGAAAAAGHAAARDGLLDAATALDQRSPTYYGAAWVALGRIMLTTRLLDGCS